MDENQQRVLDRVEQEILLLDPQLHHALTTGRLRTDRGRLAAAAVAVLLLCTTCLVAVTAATGSHLAAHAAIVCFVCGALIWVARMP